MGGQQLSVSGCCWSVERSGPGVGVKNKAETRDSLVSRERETERSCLLASLVERLFLARSVLVTRAEREQDRTGLPYGACTLAEKENMKQRVLWIISSLIRSVITDVN